MIQPLAKPTVDRLRMHVPTDGLAGVAVQEHGAVVRVIGTSFHVRTPSGELQAKKAKSCLMEPALGDYVLVSSSNGGAYVLAVLEREEGAPATLAFEGDLRIAPTGQLSLSSEVSVDIASPRRVKLASKEIDIEASSASILVDALSVVGARLKADVTAIRIVGDALDSVFQRVSQSMKRSFRIVEETDHLDARDIAWSAEENLVIHAGNTVLTSEDLVKLDANQIHLG